MKIVDLGLAAAVLLGAIACSGNSSGGSSSSGSSSSGSSSGSSSSGGSSGSSGGSGGSSSGSRPTGGTTSAASGGAAATGGTMSAAGGSTPAPAGGTGPTGGSISAATGGTRPSGGTTSVATGGAAPTGGSISAATGGTRPTGGSTSAATGGTRPTGGTSSAAGRSSTGGSGGSGTTPITIWMAGDSTMMNCSSACPCGWGSQFDPYFNANVTVSDQAVGGRSVQTWLYESAVSSTIGSNGECTLTSTTYASRWTSMLASMKAGDYLFIAFGINDGDSTCPRHVGSARFIELFGVMAQAAKAKGVTPVFLTPTAAIACSGSSATQNRGFITETKSAGTANGVTVIDLNALSVALYTKAGLCPNSGDYTSTTSAVGQFFCDDHTHFESAGAKQVAGVVANAIRTQVPALAPYLL